MKNVPLTFNRRPLNVGLMLALFVILLINASCRNKNTRFSDIDTYYNLSSRYYTEFNDSIHHLAAIIDSAEVSEDQLSKIYVIYGQSSLLLANYDQAVSEFLKAKNVLKENRNDTILIRVLFGLGNAYSNLGQFDKALNVYFEAEKVALNKNLSIELGKSYGGISQVFQIKEDLDNAKRFIFKAIPLLKPKKSSYYNAQLTLANIYGMSGKMDSAFYIDNICLNELVDHKNTMFESFFYNNKGNCYMYSGGYDSSAYYFKKCLAIDTLFADTKQIVDSYINLVTLYSLKNDSAELNKYFKKAYLLCNRTKFTPGIVQLYQSMNTYYSSKNDFKRSNNIKDSLYYYYRTQINQKTEDKISQLKIRYDDEKRVQEIKQREQQIASQRIILFLIILVFIISIVFAIFYISQSKKRRDLEIQKIVNEQNQLATRRVFLSEQRERMRIARDIHDSLGQKLVALKMQLNNSKNANSETQDQLSNIITEVRNISHNLIPEELNFGLVSAIENLTAGALKSKSITLVVDDNIKNVTINQIQALNIYRVLQEIIANNLKHSVSDHIDINMVSNDSTISVVFKDNGQKINKQQIISSKGIGWKNIFARLNLLMAKIEFDYENGNIIKITIPIQNELNGEN